METKLSYEIICKKKKLGGRGKEGLGKGVISSKTTCIICNIERNK